MMTLDKLEIGKDAVIEVVNCDDPSLRRHILDMGLTSNTRVTLVKTAPMGDPIQIRVRGYELVLRKADAAKITVKNIQNVKDYKRTSRPISKVRLINYCERKFDSTKKDCHKISEGQQISFALVGNQNCGKTTLFNQLTGANQHVGNFPGVTVDKKCGIIRNHTEAIVTDLPGIYSLSPYTSEEVVTREFIFKEKPDAIINIIDATNIERNLYLTMQLIELNIPMVLALNMMDEVRANGGAMNISAMEGILGIPVIPISASKNEGIDELVERAIQVAALGERTDSLEFYDADVSRCIYAVAHFIEESSKKYGIPIRFAATKLVEGDNLISDVLHINTNEAETLECMITHMEKKIGNDRMSVFADMRFDFIERFCQETVIKPKESIEHKRSVAIDKILTGKYTALPAFICILGIVFWLTFGTIGGFLSDIMEKGIESVTDICDGMLTVCGVNSVIHSLIINGIFAGVGSVLSFLPVIVVLFFFLSILEDSGYMARVAFVMDSLFVKIGLSGRSFVPMLIGFGCSVPAVMATKTLPSERDRMMTIFLIPFMSCSAKLPIYAFFATAFFPAHKVFVIIAMYIIGILVGIVFAFLLKDLTFRGNPVPFVLELPNYRIPSNKNVVRLMWEKAKDFIIKTFTIIFIAAILIWFLQSFDYRLNMVTDSTYSLLAMLGGFIAPVFKPLGFADWRISAALITGFTAKESVVSTLTVLMGSNNDALRTMFTGFTAIVFLVFTLLYTPCVAAIGTIKKEISGKKAIIVVILQCGIAWIIAFLVHFIGSLAEF